MDNRLFYCISVFLQDLFFFFYSSLLNLQTNVSTFTYLQLVSHCIIIQIQLFPRPKDRFEKDRTREVVYKIKYDNCAWVDLLRSNRYRALTTRIGEHREATRNFNEHSKSAQNPYGHNHIVDFKNVNIVRTEHAFHKRLFFRSLVLHWGQNCAGNDHISITDIYIIAFVLLTLFPDSQC